MQQNDWTELVPFYVAGTLPDDERRWFEQILRDVPEAQRELDEWIKIRELVLLTAQKQSFNLPPLSDGVRRQLAADVTQENQALVLDPASGPVSAERTLKVRRVSPQAETVLPTMTAMPPLQPTFSRRRVVPLTLVASLLTVLFLGGLILVLLNRNASDETEQFAAALITNTPLALETQATLDDAGILTAQPESTNVFAWATNTPMAEMATTGNLDLPTDQCVVIPLEGLQVSVYEMSRTDAEIVATLSGTEYRVTRVFDPGGWYEIIAQEGGVEGWVRAAEVSLAGPCSDLPSPTPPADTDASTCAVTGVLADNPDLYFEPNFESAIILQITDLAGILPIGRTDGPWLRTRYDIEGSVWVGWINIDTSELTGDCSSLPVFSADGVLQSASGR